MAERGFGVSALASEGQGMRTTLLASRINISIAIGEDVYDTYAIRPRCILNGRARPSARETARPSAACDLRRF